MRIAPNRQSPKVIKRDPRLFAKEPNQDRVPQLMNKDGNQHDEDPRQYRLRGRIAAQPQQDRRQPEPGRDSDRKSEDPEVKVRWAAWWIGQVHGYWAAGGKCGEATDTQLWDDSPSRQVFAGLLVRTRYSTTRARRATRQAAAADIGCGLFASCSRI